MKFCPRCQTTKDDFTFGKDKKGRLGLSFWCRPCTNDYARERYPLVKERIRKSSKATYRRRINTYRNDRLTKNYGLSLEDYNKRLVTQDGVCAICKLPDSTGHSLAVDHSHTTGKIRGLLCKVCNLAIGNFRDNPIIMREAAKYLEEFSKL